MSDTSPRLSVIAVAGGCKADSNDEFLRISRRMAYEELNAEW